VNREVYLAYARATSSAALVTMAILACLLGQAARNGSDWWLSYWSQHSDDSAAIGFFVGVFAVFGVLTAVLFLSRNLLVTVCGLRAARTLHVDLVSSVLRAPMSFMDSTPTGRLLNRFTKDTDVLDMELPSLTAQYLTVVFSTLGALALVSFVTPFFLLPIALVGAIYIYVQRYYAASSRELKRLQSIARSPIFVHFQETIAGASSVSLSLTLCVCVY
jgi:ABC-type multidrug transport system fused ATPase/permease subunit